MEFIQRFHNELNIFKKEYLNDISVNSLIFENINFNEIIKIYYDELDRDWEIIKELNFKIDNWDSKDFSTLEKILNFINLLNKLFLFIKNLEKFNEYNIKIGSSLYVNIMKEYQAILYKYFKFNNDIDAYLDKIYDQFNLLLNKSNEEKINNLLENIPYNINFYKLFCSIDINNFSEKNLFIYNKIERAIKTYYIDSEINHKFIINKDKYENNNDDEISTVFLYNYFIAPYTYSLTELKSFFKDIDIDFNIEININSDVEIKNINIIKKWCDDISNNGNIKIYFINDIYNYKKVIYYNIEKIRNNNQIQFSGITENLINTFKNVDSNKLETEIDIFNNLKNNINEILNITDKSKFIIISYIGDNKFRILKYNNLFLNNDYIKNEFYFPICNMKTKLYNNIFTKNSNIENNRLIPDKFENDYTEFVLKYDTIKMDTVKLKLNRIMQDLTKEIYNDIDSLQRLTNFINSNDIIKQFDLALYELLISINETVDNISKMYTEDKIIFIKNEIYISFIAEKTYYSKRFKNNLEEYFNDLKKYIDNFKDKPNILLTINNIFEKTISETITRKSNIYEKLLIKLFVLTKIIN